jgi:hypothetical protein
MNSRDVQDAFESGERIDQAMNRAFFAAVRLHRLHGVPMALWEDGKVCQVDPFTIALPEEIGDVRSRARGVARATGL